MNVTRRRRAWAQGLAAVAMAVYAHAGILAQSSPLPVPDLKNLTAANRADVERDAIQFVKAVRASDIDPDLPQVRFDRWLDSVLNLPARWEMTDCGRERRDGHGPYCIQVGQSSRAVELQLLLGNDVAGIVGPPRLLAATIRLFDIDSSFDRLPELPDLLVEAEARRQRFADHPMQTMTMADVERLRGRTRAVALDASLADEPFETWLGGVLAGHAPVEWSLVSCSAIANAAAPQCVNIDTRWTDGARARVTLDLEMMQRGLAAEPVFRRAFIYRGQPSRTVEPYSSLRLFGEAVRPFAEARR